MLLKRILIYFQSLVKLHVFLGKLNEVLDLGREFHEIYRRNRDRENQIKVLDKWLSYADLAHRIMKYIYHSAEFVLVVIPIGLLFFGVRMAISGITFPYIDPRSSPGFEVNLLFACYMFHLTTNGLTASDSVIVVYELLGMGHLKMIQGMVKELGEILNRKDAEDNEEEIDNQIRRILIEHETQLR